jgi:fluoroacetyl-CoA thioesterase
VTESIRVGLEHSVEFVVEGRLLTDVGGTLGFAVLSTPSMIGLMERSAAALIHPLLDEGKATVGFEVHVRHVASAPEGTRCIARARLTEIIQGRKLRFEVEVASAAGQTIGLGTHERRVIDAGPGARAVMQPRRP